MRPASRALAGLGCGLLLVTLADCLESTVARAPTSSGCRTDADCPSMTPPLGARCVNGVCATVDLCAEGTCTGADCHCPCADDAQCASGTVCEPGNRAEDCSGPKECVPGCHRSEQCAPGLLCAVPDCFGCACPGVCYSVSTCSSNHDCPFGEVCGEGERCERACMPGCRDASECDPGEICAPRSCDACGCATPTCQAAPACTSDPDCPRGTVCGLDVQCNRRCVPGCNTNDDCAQGESCQPQACDNCLCSRSKCQPIGACSDDRTCPRGTVCEAAPSCASPKRCLPGCHTSAQCAPGEVCDLPTCRDCPCTGTCTSQTQRCAADRDCPAGEVCEPGPGCIGDLRCVPGCHGNSQCAPTERCDTQLDCVTCPCPGVCEVDPCRDLDGDGYTANCQNAPPCPGLGECDCDDDDPDVHPGAPERCGNLRDDDCDGALDEGCDCPGGVGACRRDLDCPLGFSFCFGGCCVPCPTGTPSCDAGECLSPTRADLHGCTGVTSCGACCACPTLYAPVCGLDYGSYGNECEASCAGTGVLHADPCLRGEGLACDAASTGSCAAGQYCRDPCPRCSGLHPWRCTEVGVCTEASDCPAGMTPRGCAGGAGSWSCVRGLCAFSCP